MVIYYFYLASKSLKPETVTAFINSTRLSRKKRNRLLKKSGICIESECMVTPPFYFQFGHITIGHNAFINANCVFLDNATISIGQGALIGPNVTLSTASHPIDPLQRNNGIISAPIAIGENCWLGAGTVVLHGVTIGKNSVIAANSVVTSDVPEGALYAGSPAVFKRWL